VRTAILSDLHLGAGPGGDLLRRPRFREPLLEALDGCDRIVLLGDVVELRDRPIGDAFELATPTLRAIGEIAAEGELVIVPGNHDHHLVEAWLERRGLEGEPPLGLEQDIDPQETPLAALADQLDARTVLVAYPGVRIRDDVYAMHGHYLDRHLTIPTFERLGVAAVERLLGFRPPEADPLEPPAEPSPIDPIEYEHAQAPVYALLFALAQGATVERGAGGPSIRIWSALGGGETMLAKMRGWLLGSVAVPGAVGIANRLGLGPVSSDLSPASITRAGIAAMRQVVERLGIGADHVVFGHTHRRGPLPADREWTAGEARLWNTGSWVHSPSLLGPTAAKSPYWPGTVCFVDDSGGAPELRHVLDDLERADLAD
jgi:predicted phosphodiesterase